MMANGYIHPVADGEITDLRAFAIRCARAMMPLVLMRDAPMSEEPPDEFTADTAHYEERLVEAQERLDKLAAATDSERRAIFAAEQLAEEVSRAKYDGEAEVEYQRVSDMLQLVVAWDGGPDGLKKFMLEQLTDALRENNPETYAPYAPKVPTYDEWLEREWKRAIESVGRAYSDIAREKAMTVSRNIWLKQLHASLPPNVNTSREVA